MRKDFEFNKRPDDDFRDLPLGRARLGFERE